MNVKVYDCGIIAPCKCGTRFLERVANVVNDTSESDIFKNTKWREFSGWILYRPPYEWLVSALHTEILNRKEEESINDILDRFLRNGGTTHWTDTTFKRMWEFLSKNKKCKGIPLNQLSKLLRTLNIETEKWNPSDWDFNHLKNWIPIEQLVEELQTNHPIEWEWLMECVKDEEKYYNKIVNGEWKEIKLI